MTQLITPANILLLSYSQVACTTILSCFAFFSKDTPDIILIFLILLCTCGDLAWIKHVDQGYGSKNALLMFQFGALLGGTAFCYAVFRRVKFGPMPSQEDFDSDDEDQMLSIVDVKKKNDTMLEISTKGEEIRRLNKTSKKKTKSSKKKN